MKARRTVSELPSNITFLILRHPTIPPVMKFAFTFMYNEYLIVNARQCVLFAESYSRANSVGLHALPEETPSL